MVVVAVVVDVVAVVARVVVPVVGASQSTGLIFFLFKFFFVYNFLINGTKTVIRNSLF